MQHFKSFSKKTTLYHQIDATFATSTVSKLKSKFKLFNRAAPLPNLQSYYDLRIYKNAPLGSLLRTYFINNLSKRNIFGSDCAATYEKFSRFLGRSTANNILFTTLGNAYSARLDTGLIKKDLVQYNDRNISVSIAYRMGSAPEREFSEYQLDENARKYIEIINLATSTSYKGNSISINIGALGNSNALIKINRAQNWIQSVFEPYPGRVYERLDAAAIYDKLKQKYIECEESEFAEFLSLALGRDIGSDLAREEITRFEWIQNVHAYYFGANSEKNDHKILRDINRLTNEEVHSMETLGERLKRIYEAARETRLFGVSNEVEHRDLQAVNNSVTQQFSIEYNQEQTVVLDAIQADQERVNFEVESSSYLGIPLGVKLVAGAEGRAYDGAMEYLLNNYVTGSKIIIETENLESVGKAKELIEKNSLNRKFVKLAQVEGTGDFLTFGLVREGFGVIKELQYGGKEDLVPWLVERASENTNNNTVRRIENKLVVNEIARRFRLI